MAKKLKGKSFTDEERAAMKDRAEEAKAVQGEDALLAKLAGMPEEDRAMGKRIHGIIKAAAPFLAPQLWYGMPAYYKEGKLICHFQPAGKFKTRYSTLGFSDKAKLDEGSLWPVAFALKELGTAEEARIVALVKRAAS